ncbi:mannan-binding lectin serine protease 1-like [Asterias amurensis]|uniref:mannan-binding lectin serine protease 1-like n=1 Tax=Asterias amurensis TaxID=7602 RepID=UPI003AB6684B
MAGKERTYVGRCASWCVLLLVLLCIHHVSSISQLTDTHGIIQSTNYPLPYPDNLNVRWEINVKAGHRVKLYFIEFDLEPGTKGCNADYVLVLSGNNTLGKFCGRETPDVSLTSLSNNMVVVFHSDYSTPKRHTGFDAHYVAEDINECMDGTDECEHFCHNGIGSFYCSCQFGYTLDQDQKTCTVHCSGNVIESPSGVITSPGYPYSYPRQSECDWLIRAEAGYVISLTFEDFDVESHSDTKCPYDALRIKQDKRTLGPFCGNMKSDWPQEIQADELIKIFFVSDKSGLNRGFRARFRSLGKPCEEIEGPTNGAMSLLNNTVGNEALFSCDEGYRLVGQASRTCLKSGKWSGNGTTCEVVRCPRLQRRVNHGRITMSQDPPIYDSSASYSCDSFYELNSLEVVRVCQSDGTWSGEEPKCIPICGKSSITPRGRTRSRIIGGKEAREGSWPWVVKIEARSKTYRVNNLCGGSLISENWVLTAAHCVTATKIILKGLYGQKLPADSITISLGIHAFNGSNIERGVIEVFRAPSYDTALFDGDVALLLLDSPVVLTRQIRPLCIPDDETFSNDEFSEFVTLEDTEAIAVGWGTTGRTSRSETLQEVYLPLVNLETCNDAMRSPVTVDMLCAGLADGGRDTCYGDSGGPLMLKASNERYYAYGITSWGEGNCAQQGKYGVYSRVGNFADWIREVTQI